VFFRAGLTVPVVLIWLALRGRIVEGLRTARPGMHLRRGVVGSISMGLGFAGLRYLPLPEVTALQFATPILIVIFAALMLGERIRAIRITAVAAGLVGVTVIVWPRLTAAGDGAELFGASLVLCSAGLAALAQIFVKSMAGKEGAVAIVFWFSLSATLLSLFTIPFGWVMPTPPEFALLLGAGMLGGLGQLALTNSYRFADVSVLAPFTYVSMLWSILFGFVFFGEVPTVLTLAGAALIIAAGVAIWLRERQLGKRMATEGKVGAKGLQ
jgi:drug/metabolite transporter (DMT)-like permease